MSKLLAYLPKVRGASPIPVSEMLLYFEKVPVPVVRVQPIAGMLLRLPETSKLEWIRSAVGSFWGELGTGS